MLNYLLSALSLTGVSLAVVAPQPLALSNGKVSAEQHERTGLGYLRLPVHKNNPTTRNAANRKRQDVGLPLENVISSYSITLSIGTPPQTVEVLFDTGSSELWVNPSCATSADPVSCDLNGLYNASASSTSVNLGTPFSIAYGSGSVSGTYVTDTINVGGAILKADQFGSGITSSGILSGIFGAGLGNGFLTMNYNSVIDNLRADGIIQSRAFSLDLASINVADGSVIFGGIDTTKYSGSLQKMAIIPYTSAPQRYPRYWINLSAVAVAPPGANNSTTLYNTLITVVLDSGSTWSYLPAALFDAILAQFPSATSVGGGQYIVPCSVQTLTGSLQFLFGTTWINVSYHEFIWFNGGNCYIAAVSAGVPYILGDSFMRSAYFVYDQDNFNIHVAQAAACTTAVSNVVPISTGVNAVPSIVGGCNPGSTVVISTSTSALVTTSTSIGVTSSSLVVSSRATTTSTSQVRSTIVVSSSRSTSTSQVKSTSILSSSKITSLSSTSRMRSSTVLSSSKIISTSQARGTSVFSRNKIASTAHVGTPSLASSSKIASASHVVSSLGVSSSLKSTIVSAPTSHIVKSAIVSSSQLVGRSFLSSPSRTITSTTQLVRSTTASNSKVLTSSSTIASTSQPGSSHTASRPSSSTITLTIHGIISSSAPSSLLSTSTSAPQAAATGSTLTLSASPSSSSQATSSLTSGLSTSSSSTSTSSTFAQTAATSSFTLVLSSSSTSSSTLQAATSFVVSSFPSSSVSSSLSSSTILSTSTVVSTSIVYATSIVISTSTIVSTSTFIEISPSPAAAAASSFLTAIGNSSALSSSTTLSSSSSTGCAASVTYTVTVTSVSLVYTGAYGACTTIGQSF